MAGDAAGGARLAARAELVVSDEPAALRRLHRRRRHRRARRRRTAGGRSRESAHGSWQATQPTLVRRRAPLFIADLDNNNIDDIIKLERTVFPVGPTMVGERFTWWVSDNGRSRWRNSGSTTRRMRRSGGARASRPAFAGRFGVAPGGGVLLIRHDRIGRFFSKAEEATGASPDWTSLYAF